MRLILSFSALFLSVLLLQLSSGGVAPLDALSGLALDFTKTQVGMLGSAHFVGFFIGCWWAPRLMGAVGHARAFAVFTALGAIGLLAHMMWIDATAWAVMRLATGLCVAGCYTVIEAWMNTRATNQNRGRVMGSYRIVDLGGSLAAQLLIGVLEPAHYLSYNVLRDPVLRGDSAARADPRAAAGHARGAAAQAGPGLALFAARRGRRGRIGRHLGRVPHGRAGLRPRGRARDRPDRRVPRDLRARRRAGAVPARAGWPTATTGAGCCTWISVGAIVACGLTVAVGRGRLRRGDDRRRRCSGS